MSYIKLYITDVKFKAASDDPQHLPGKIMRATDRLIRRMQMQFALTVVVRT